MKIPNHKVLGCITEDQLDRQARFGRDFLAVNQPNQQRNRRAGDFQPGGLHRCQAHRACLSWCVSIETDHGEIVRDIIIGYADGLTVPFALTAGLSS